MALIAGCGSSEPARDSFRWGADQEGGGPFVFPHPDDPTRITGFEKDLADALGERTQLKAEFVQCTWDQMLPVLDRGDIHLALNGYEHTPQRAEQFLASLPYYIYELGLCARHDNANLRDWNALRRPKPDGGRWRVGVIESSSSDAYVTKEFAETCEPFRFPGASEAFRLVESRQLDATVQDLPALLFYIERLRRYPHLAIVDEPAARGYYVIYAHPTEGPLVEKVNRAIRELHADGTLRRIYEEYGIWNETQEGLAKVWEGWHSELAAEHRDKWLDLRRQIPLLISAAGVTVLLAVISMPLAILIGLSVSLIRAWGSPVLGGGGAAEGWPVRLARFAATLYIEIVRGTPLAFQLWVVFFILPEFGLTIHKFWAGVIALAMNYSAYEAEIFRLGLQAIPKGQMEAALSLGMSRALAVRRVILPQAWRMVIPASANDFIALFKDTAVCSVIAVEELSKQYSMGAKDTNLYLEMTILASILYLAMSYPLSLLAGWLERRLKR